MGCPVPKIARHNAGCSLMREPSHAASVVAAMAKAVKIPVTVKMRAGWNDDERNAPTLARMVQDAGAAAGGRARADGGAELQRAWPTGRWSPRSPASCGFQCSAAVTASSRGRSSIDCRRASRVCSSDGVSFAIHGFSRRRGPRRRPPGACRIARRPRGIPARVHRDADARAVFANGPRMRPEGPAPHAQARPPPGTIAGSSTRSAALGSWVHQGVWRTDRT